MNSSLRFSNSAKKHILLFTVLLFLSTFLLIIHSYNVVGAQQSGSNFVANRIIDDSLFYSGNEMSAAQVQQFLNARVPFCDTNGQQMHSSGLTRAQWAAANNRPQPPYICLKDYVAPTTPSKSDSGLCSPVSGQTNRTAAQIIDDVSRACNVSQKVLLVMLEKEQSLLSDTWPWPVQYEKAMGYYCPDDPNRPGWCAPEYAGFFNQVYNAARQLQRYKQSPNSFNHALGRTSYVAFQANAPSCSGSNLTMLTAATAALYNYTPYQPNQAALNNLYGTGDNCSAYGNRNFWRMFNDWFGKTIFISPLKYEPSIISQSPGKISSFARGYDNRLWQTQLGSSGWQTQWNYIDGPSSNSSAPSGISWGDGHMNVFETRDGSLWHSWYANDSIGWRSWSSLGNPQGVKLLRTPASVAQKLGKINVFARGTDGRLWQNWFDSKTGWQTQWNYIDGPSSNSSSPTAVSWGDGHMNVFETRDGSLWHSWYANDSIGWRSWQPIGRP